MTYAGARNETEVQMRQALQFTLPETSLHPAFNALLQALADREKDKNNANETNFRLNVVNALWGQQGYTFLPAYLDLLSQNYGAGMRLLDFKADPQAARQVINQWVAQQTADKIKDLIPPSALDQATTLSMNQRHLFQCEMAVPVQSGFHHPRPLQPAERQPGQRAHHAHLGTVRLLPRRWVHHA